METDQFKNPKQTMPGESVSSSSQQDLSERSSQLYGKTKQAVSQAYQKTSTELSGTYDKALNYSRENPGKVALIAAGAGLGIGLTIASMTKSRSQPSRYAQPIVNALSDVAREYFR
ncbi:hypothetical protein [Pelotalea chapellei]|uniref:Uncharacterized protein n=1 Tax=Pelotalea chapellei TaxID=44671 RepID=A0ABS5UB31_9BACT|nr:hypothetical protein [Pelotalea chapellei]MBT1072879.1 hypothetical protein [Pelotalea chapellei]